MASDFKKTLPETQPLARLAADLDAHSLARQMNELTAMPASPALTWASQHQQEYESLQALFRSREVDLRRVTLGLAEEMAQLTKAVRLPLTEWMRQAQEVSAQFVLPAVQLNTELRHALKSLDAHTKVAVKSATAELTTPWLRMGHELQSIQGIMALHGLGQRLRDAASVFSEETAAALRRQLGDWRESITLPPNILDLPVRTRYYEARGFNPLLTDFPPPAFQQVLQFSQLETEPPDVIEVREYEIPAASDQEEDGFRRTNRAHDRLQRFETHLRRFIDTQMRQGFGECWTKHQLDADTRKRWAEKHQTAQDHGEPARPLIAFADFTDYDRILLRGDNWKKAFAPFFDNPDSVRESLRRLHPIRLATMHARPISQDDELLLFVEVKRVLMAIGVLKPGRPR
jgi:hypothetical protein